VRGGGDIAAHRWTYGVRVLANQIDRATWRNTLVYRFTPDFQAGVEYNPLDNDVGPLANWRIVRETARQPTVTLGTSSDRIGTPDGRAYFALVAKHVRVSDRVGVSPYAGVMWSEFDERFRAPFGASIELGDHWTVTPMFDGHAYHQMIGYGWDRYSASLVLVRGKDPGVAFTMGF